MVSTALTPTTNYLVHSQKNNTQTNYDVNDDIECCVLVWLVPMLVCASKNGSRWSSRIVQTLFGHPLDGPGAHPMAAARENRRQPPRLDCPALAPHSALNQEKDSRAWENKRAGCRPEESIIGEHSGRSINSTNVIATVCIGRTAVNP